VGAFLNIEHVAATARALHCEQARSITIISAGELGGPSVEDDLASEHIALRLQHPKDPPSYASAEDLARDLLVTQHGSLLVRTGYGDDIAFCSQPNRYALTPFLRDGAFTAYSPG
jgi:phosphosulfolactate phosphohydrolase-like enzyme